MLSLQTVRLSVRKFSSTLLGTGYRWVVGQRLDAKSNLRPMSVQTLSNVCPISGKVHSLSNQVQGLSKVCRNPVQVRGSWTEIGHRNPAFNQTLSNKRMKETSNFSIGLSLDKYWTWTIYRQNLYMDKLWTLFGFQNL